MTSAAPPSAVATLSDDRLLAQTGTLAQLDRQVQVFLIDHLLEIDARIPYARGGGAERANLRLLSAAHHRQRHRHCHAGHRSAGEPAG